MDLFDQIKANPGYNENKSYQWFISNVTTVAKKTHLKPMDILTENQPLLTKKILPGKMYSFFYSAKYKDVLPYWDTFPCIIPFSMDDRHFTGLNLHYLPPKPRLMLLNNLMKLAVNKHNDDVAKLKLSWDLLRNVSKFPQVAPCVKQYLKPNVKSMFVEIPMSSWHIMAFMPVARFRGASEARVHSDSRKAIRR